MERDNILPKEGEAYYFGSILTPKEADYYFERLFKTIDWQQDEVIIFGKRIVTKRKTGWYGEKEFEYTYSKITRKAKIWTPELVALMKLVEKRTGLEFNSCLLNLYHSGEEGMSWHSDAEAELGKDPAIASLSLGAERKFVLKNKASGEKISLELENGSLLLMKGQTQKFWLHSLPKTKKVKEPRINLTFRKIVKTKK
ncbi:Alkylated DNA repair dioxygenase AlkB [Salinimicrobium catena]|uniref:Alkylated DNA repair dioxygenase AlkB n=1 Tax=Salinimicrobium catena TaxID=390640 RepID=A0A1H5PDG1_9FLAO|nr:alpha-ketoglutarate-dependent dioxygenase AlkB [Salinimicrobium catena]SDL79600.1 Alkylated DNA repair dioxygenase AlkB [Salinimicrobium catena]SEF11750.1 Alkylated DNA repair dioxygenase AlkB [Salinimicrobium catena]